MRLDGPLLRGWGADHARNLLPQQTPDTALFHPGNALDSSRLAHQRPIKTGGRSADDGVVITWEVPLGHWYRSSSPYVV